MGSARFRAKQRGNGKALLGLSICSFEPAFVDIAAGFEFDLIWIEMEHANISMREAEYLCRVISGHGMFSLIRLPNGSRDIVLQAVETGADMLMLPMVSTPSDTRELVKHARFSPDGERGFHKLSRSMNFGLGGTLAELRKRANDELMLWAQVENLTAVKNLDELCQVHGIDGLFAGPGDLSSAFGVPGDVADSRVVAAVEKTVSISHNYAKCAGTAAAPAHALRWSLFGADMLMVGNNLAFYVSAASALREELNKVFESATCRE
jgi:2-keto-3-deoxy-L-rhamnonate aldolase RhmA